jgi:predicted nucleic acid-binding protein
VILYLDTSSVVKLYVQELHSGRVQRIVEEVGVVATSRIAYVEARAAFARKQREEGLTIKDYRRIVLDLNRDWENYFIVDVSETLAKLAGALAEKHALRGFDAIHLASSIILLKQANQAVAFSCFDGRLAKAAQKEGLKVAK